MCVCVCVCVFHNLKQQMFQVGNSLLFKEYHFYITMLNQNPAHKLHWGEKQRSLCQNGANTAQDSDLLGKTENGGVLLHLLFANEAKVCPPSKS